MRVERKGKLSAEHRNKLRKVPVRGFAERGHLIVKRQVDYAPSRSRQTPCPLPIVKIGC